VHSTVPAAIDITWVRDQVREYTRLLPRYEEYAIVLDRIVRSAVAGLAPYAIVQTRAKTIPTFTEKILRKRARFDNPVRQLTDLCGGRIIVHTVNELDPVCRFIESAFAIDWQESCVPTNLLSTREFGYRSIHYVVSIDPERLTANHIGVDVPPSVLPDQEAPMKAEIQVRTMLEHVWASFSHEHAYKGQFKLPPRLEREFAGVAALLETADGSLRRMKDQLERYVSSYEAYLAPEQIEEEIALQEIVLDQCPEDYRVAHRVGKLAIELGDWAKASELLSKYENSDYQPILRDLGISLCKANRRTPESDEYRRGQMLLQKAVELDPSDLDALASLAGTYRGIDDEKASELYRAGFDLDPADSYVLGNFIEYEVMKRRDPSIVQMFTCAVQLAIERCLGKAEVGMDYPWVYYDLGKFYLLTSEPYLALVAYARAVDTSSALFMIETSLDSLLRLRSAFEDPEGWEWATTLLKLAKAVKFNDAEARAELETGSSRIAERLQESTIVVAGSTDSSVEHMVSSCRDALTEALGGIRATIISGGTKSGVSGLVGHIQERYPDTLNTIGYLPRDLPPGIEPDTRFSELVRIEDKPFSPEQPLRYWRDIVASGANPTSVKVVGIGGGGIAGIEYRLALALGASVAMLQCPDINVRPNGYDLIWPMADRVRSVAADRDSIRNYLTGA